MPSTFLGLSRDLQLAVLHCLSLVQLRLLKAVSRTMANRCRAVLRSEAWQDVDENRMDLEVCMVPSNSAFLTIPGHSCTRAPGPLPGPQRSIATVGSNRTHLRTASSTTHHCAELPSLAQFCRSCVAGEWRAWEDCASAASALGVSPAIVRLVARGAQPPSKFAATLVDPMVETDALRELRMADALQSHRAMRSARRRGRGSASLQPDDGLTARRVLRDQYNDEPMSVCRVTAM